MESSTKTFDAVIFGASGFTGKQVVKWWLKLASKESGWKPTVAIAGRSLKKLQDVLEWAEASPADVPIILADVHDPASLQKMCEQTKLVLNCVGPFRYWGEAVVRACIKEGIDYLDVCGEPEFMEQMEISYNELAYTQGSLVVSSCGIDSVPADLGVIYALDTFLRSTSGKGVPLTTDSVLFLTAHGRPGGNFGTWESLVQGMGSAESLRKLRSSQPKPPPLPIPGRPPKRPQGAFVDPQSATWLYPFPGADASVVKRSVRVLLEHPTGLPTKEGIHTVGSADNDENEDADESEEVPKEMKPVHYAAYISLGFQRWNVYLFLFFGAMIKWLAGSAWGRKALLTFPTVFSYGFFSHAGPTQQQLDANSFEMVFVTKGWGEEEGEQVQVVTQVKGPEAGYVATPIILVQCAFTLLRGRGKMPVGGVLTPGVAFGFTGLQKRLNESGVTFRQMSK